jgi:BirA family biotin operon repressor/biotin-[acetyl-CoA-carboxylase] ligase
MIKLDSIDLKILELTDKQVISGEKLSSLFGISRTAIWKRIKKLENLDYKFSHLPEGYKLTKRTAYLLENEIKPFLNTKLIGKNFIFFEKIDSTNIYLKNNQLEEGSVVFAETQTSGKGRKGRKWVSVKGKGLYFSINLKPKININQLLKFSLIFPLSIHKTIADIDLKAKIKWPNDIYINNKKVCGILIETDIEANDIKRVIAGIGININNFPEELSEIKDIATSLYIEKGEIIDRKKFFINLLENIEDYYLKFLEEKINPVSEVEKNMLWINEKIILIDEKNKIEGILKGLNEYGGIRISKNGKILDFYTGDLTIRHI